MNVCEVENLTLVVPDEERDVHKIRSFRWGALSPLVYNDVIHMI